MVRRQRGYHIRAERCRLPAGDPIDPARLGRPGDTGRAPCPMSCWKGAAFCWSRTRASWPCSRRTCCSTSAARSWWPCASTRPWIMFRTGEVRLGRAGRQPGRRPQLSGSRPAVRALHAVPVRDRLRHAGLEEAYRSAPVLQKPYQAAPLAHLLTQLLTCEAPMWGRADEKPRRAPATGRKGNPPERSLSRPTLSADDPTQPPEALPAFPRSRRSSAIRQHQLGVDLRRSAAGRRCTKADVFGATWGEAWCTGPAPTPIFAIARYTP